MTRRFAGIAAALGLALATISPAWGSVTVTGGTRGATISATGPIGQSFVADGTALTSFGFQFGVANTGSTATPLTFQLLSGAGLTGDVLQTRTASPTIPTGRTPTWYDFDLTGTALAAGQSYTAVVSTTSDRLALFFGPALSNSGVPASGDAYTSGRLYSTNYVDASGASGFCAGTTGCDANFRFTTLAAAAVPEPSMWLLMIAGIGMTGAFMRRRPKAMLGSFRPALSDQRCS